MTRVLPMFEYSSVGVNERDGFQLSLAEAAAISRFNRQLGRRYGTRRDILKTEFDGSKPRRLVSSSFVGVVSVGRKLIHILPKMAKGNPGTESAYSDQAIENLLYMLRYTRKITVREAGVVALPKVQGDLLEVLIFPSQIICSGLSRTIPIKSTRIAR